MASSVALLPVPATTGTHRQPHHGAFDHLKMLFGDNVALSPVVPMSAIP